MQPINMIYYWAKKLKKRLHVLETDITTIKKSIDFMCVVPRVHFLQEVFQMTIIVVVSEINHYLSCTREM